MKFKWASLFSALVFAIAGSAVSLASAQQSQGSTNVVHLTGLAGVEENAKGILSVENGTLHFVHGKTVSDVNAASIEDVVTGGDSQETVGKTIGTLGMAAPYGSGRVLSLFRTKIDSLTIQYRDSDGGLHGAIFTMATGKADGIKKDLLATGAHSISRKPNVDEPASASTLSQEERKQ